MEVYWNALLMPCSIIDRHADLATLFIFWSANVQELSQQELDHAGGGVLPLVGFGLAVVGKAAGSSGVVTWAVSSASLILSTYEAAKYLDGLKEE